MTRRRSRFSRTENADYYSGAVGEKSTASLTLTRKMLFALVQRERVDQQAIRVDLEHTSVASLECAHQASDEARGANSLLKIFCGTGNGFNQRLKTLSY